MLKTGESVWDYPRPPRVEINQRHLRVVHEGTTLADTHAGFRVLETSHPPCYYIPPEAVDWSRLEPSATRTVCEFKGHARYWSLRTTNGLVEDVCWAYDKPRGNQDVIARHVSFFAARVDACFVDQERVTPQAGDFYGGWITSDIQGPFKGGPGTQGW